MSQYDPQFSVSVLKVMKGKYPLPKDLRTELSDNATYLRAHNLWLFEGDWELVLESWLADIEHLGDVIVPSLGSMNEGQIWNYIKHMMERP